MVRVCRAENHCYEGWDEPLVDIIRDLSFMGGTWAAVSVFRW